jgi:hypothetical protein
VRAVCAGKPLEDARLLPEISILFMAGFESAHIPFTAEPFFTVKLICPTWLHLVP